MDSRVCVISPGTATVCGARAFQRVTQDGPTTHLSTPHPPPTVGRLPSRGARAGRRSSPRDLVAPASTAARADVGTATSDAPRPSPGYTAPRTRAVSARRVTHSAAARRPRALFFRACSNTFARFARSSFDARGRCGVSGLGAPAPRADPAGAPGRAVELACRHPPVVAATLDVP